MSALHLCLLGQFQLTYNDQPVTTIQVARLQEFLAYLALQAPQSRQEIAYLFWPDSTESQARTNLRKLWYRLRQALPEADHFLEGDAQTIRWRPEADFTLDVAQFETCLQVAEAAAPRGDHDRRLEQLQTAAALYKGDLLPGCYSDWLLAERERLHIAYTFALEQIVDLLQANRDYKLAIYYAQKLLQHDQLHEAAYRLLMRLYALNNDRGRALRVYHTCATILQRELSVTPGTATQAVYEQLLNEEPTSISGQTIESTSSTFVGRQKAWQMLLDQWRLLVRSDNRSHFILISGEAGIGKTRLAEEFLEWARRQGITVAAAHCYPTTQNLAYAPIAAWLRLLPLLEQPDVRLTEVARILPEIFSQRPSLERPTPLHESWQRLHFFQALVQAVLDRRQPILLLLDDIQWCDEETLEWLAYLLRYDPHSRLMVVGTCRLEEIPPDHPAIALLRGSAQRTDISLAPLAEAETLLLANDLAGRPLDAAQSQALFQQTEGNPLFVVETVRAGLETLTLAEDNSPIAISPHASPLSPRLQAVLEARLAPLSPSAQTLLHIAAVIGRSFTFSVLCQVSSEVEDTVVRGLDELWRRKIVREGPGDAYDFTHDKLRHVAYQKIPLVKRRHLHRQLADALTRLDTPARLLAGHWVAAGEGEVAIEQFRQACRQAIDVYSFSHALEAVNQAFSLLPYLALPEKQDTMRINLLRQRIWLDQRLVDIDQWQSDVTELEQLALRYADNEALLDVLESQVILASFASQVTLLQDVSQRALLFTEKIESDIARARLLNTLSERALELMLDPATLLPQLTLVVDIARREQDIPLLISGLCNLSFAQRQAGLGLPATECAAEARRLALTQTDQAGLIERAELMVAYNAYERAEWQRAWHLIRPLMPRLEKLQELPPLTLGYYIYILLATDIGQHAAAVAMLGRLQAGLERIEPATIASVLPWTKALALATYLQAGYKTETESALADCLNLLNHAGDSRGRIYLLTTIGSTHLARLQAKSALTYLNEAAELWQRAPSIFIQPLIMHTIAAAQIDQIEAARHSLALAEDMLQTADTRRFDAQMHFARFLVDGDSNHLRRAWAELEQQAAVFPDERLRHSFLNQVRLHKVIGNLHRAGMIAPAIRAVSMWALQITNPAG